MHFQVPQFIETEDKIIGPFTLKQFLLIAGGGFSSFLLYFIVDIWLWVVLVAIIMPISISFAFVKINGRSLYFFVKSAAIYIWRPKTYVYKIKKEHEPEKSKKTKKQPIPIAPGGNKMKNIGDKLATTKEAIPKRELALPPSLKEGPEKVKERYEYVEKITGDREKARRVDYK